MGDESSKTIGIRNIQDVFKKVEIFMHGVDSLSEGLTALAESTTTGLSAVDDQLIKAARGGCGYGYRIPILIPMV